MERTGIIIDANWVTPAALADELAISRSTVKNWIKRNQIDYIVLPGAIICRHLVDKRTAPEKKGPFGRPILTK